jgi:large subunit ribosomal protein L23
MSSKFLIHHPIISEKATTLSALRKYVFLVDPRATASEVRKAVQKEYKVDVVDINMINVKSKARRLGQTMGTKSGYRKAVVTLKSGQKLDILPQA